jgi:predicted RNA-binding Zn-ribbon protein involved in translation (DUF1610 family)
MWYFTKGNRMHKTERKRVSIDPFKCEECGFTGRLVTGFPGNCIQSNLFKCPKCDTGYKF